MFREEPIVVGIVLDLSLRHMEDGARIVDGVKDELVEYVRTFDYVDLFYLYHENVIDVVEGLGKRIHSVASYQTDGFEFDLNYALKQTLYIIGSEDDDKQIYLITEGKLRYAKAEYEKTPEGDYKNVVVRQISEYTSGQELVDQHQIILKQMLKEE